MSNEIRESRWVYVTGDGTEMGWFTDDERAQLDSVRQPDADYTWRELTADEVEAFAGYVTRLARDQN